MESSWLGPHAIWEVLGLPVLPPLFKMTQVFPRSFGEFSSPVRTSEDTSKHSWSLYLGNGMVLVTHGSFHLYISKLNSSILICWYHLRSLIQLHKQRCLVSFEDPLCVWDIQRGLLYATWWVYALLELAGGGKAYYLGHLQMALEAYIYATERSPISLLIMTAT